MATVRQTLETRLAAFAAANNLQVAWEDKPFSKPTTEFLECVIVPAATLNVTVDGNRTRELGVMQVNVWWPSGKGAGPSEVMADKLIAAFPMVPPVGDVYITQQPYKSRAIKDEAGWRIVPVTIGYRKENEVVPT